MIPKKIHTDKKEKLQIDLKELVDQFHDNLISKGYHFKLSKLSFHPTHEFGDCGDCPGEYDPATGKTDCSRC